MKCQIWTPLCHLLPEADLLSLSQVMRDEVAAKLYRRLLRDEVVSRRIDEAASPASVLQTLCEKVCIHRSPA